MSIGDVGDDRGSADAGQEMPGSFESGCRGPARLTLPGGSRAIATLARRRGWQVMVGGERRCGRHGIEASRSAQRTLDAPVAGVPSWQGSAVAAACPEDDAGRSRARCPEPTLRTADPCLPARAGVRGLAPGVRFRHGPGPLTPPREWLGRWSGTTRPAPGSPGGSPRGRTLRRRPRRGRRRSRRASGSARRPAAT